MFTVTVSLACLVPTSDAGELLLMTCDPQETEWGSPVGGALDGVSATTERLRMQVRRLGPHFRTALISGERGLRKEAIARALHAASPAAERPFLVCDASSIERLGQHGPSAPAVAADDDVLDFLNEARGGTIFVRELGRLSPAAQSKLLSLLDAIENIGGERIRVIGSVSGDVRVMAAAGILRSELLARMGTVELAVTPLRERKEEIGAIAMRLLEGTSAHKDLTLRKIEDAAVRELEGRDWPGNERELESLLRMALLASGGAEIEEWHLPAANPSQSELKVAEPTISMRLEDVVEAHMLEVLRRCEGNKVKAAEVLGMSRSTLYRMLEASSVIEGPR